MLVDPLTGVPAGLLIIVTVNVVSSLAPKKFHYKWQVSSLLGLCDNMHSPITIMLLIITNIMIVSCMHKIYQTLLSTLRAGLKDRQTRQLPRAPKQEGPPGFHHSKALDIELST